MDINQYKQCVRDILHKIEKDATYMGGDVIIPMEDFDWLILSLREVIESENDGKIPISHILSSVRFQ